MANSLGSAWKLARWMVLAALLVVIVLMLRQPAPVARALDAPERARRAADFQAKVQQLAEAHQAGSAGEAHFNADEINAALQQATPELTTAAQQAGVAQAAPVQTTQVFFRDDTVVGQFQTQLYGKDVTVTAVGRLGSKDGVVTFVPTEFKIGDMPVPVSLVEPSLQRKLAEPENRDKLKLPPFVASIRIERGELVVVEK